MKTESVEQLALKSAQLPSLPDLVNDLQSLIEQQVDLNVIADLLATDASLSIQVIELANSAFYGNKNISRIFEAVHLIGLNRIELFVRTAYVVQLLKSLDGKVIHMRQFWQASIISALTARALAGKVNYPQPDTLYTAGLLMDIGRLILALLPTAFDRTGIEPHQLAAAQLRLWNFPPVISEAIRYVKQPSASSDALALPAAIIHLVDLMLGQDPAELDEEALLLTALSEDDIVHFAEEMKKLGVPQTRRFRVS